MPKNPCRRPLSIAALCLVLAAALALVPTWSWAAAGACSIFSTPDTTMPRTAPQALWGELKPAGVILDTTGYTGNQRADSRYPQPTSVDVENGYLFASYWAGFMIFDLHTTPEAPVKLSTIDGWSGGGFPQWLLGQSETDQFIYAIDAPEGDDSIIALGGISPMGFSIWDTRNKSAPTALYQDANGKEIAGLWATTINGREYAFAGGAFSGGEYGLFVYDMTAARSFHGCLEDVSHGVRNCPGVYITKISTGGGAVQYVHGMQFGSKTYVVTSPGQSSIHGVQIWDVSNPANPIRVVIDFTPTSLATFTSGVALWQQGSSAYLAVRFESALEVFNVTACLTGGCSALPSPISVLPVQPVTESDYWKTVTYSKSGSTPFLFLGNQLLCHAGQPPGHIEYLLDMTDPTLPRDITPAGTTNFMNEPVDYWSYYYNDDIKGLAFSASRTGKMYAASNGNSYFYRTDLTLFDVHQWTGGANTPPTPNFTWSPSPAYAGDSITFTDTSGGLVSSRAWTFPGGAPGTDTRSPVSVTFSTADTKSVGLTVFNAAAPQGVSITKPVTVLDPSPAVTGATASVSGGGASGPVCSPVTLTAVGATGRGTLAFSWNVKDPNSHLVVTGGAGSPYLWDTTGLSPGIYTAAVTVSNGFGSPATSPPTNVTLTALDPLPGAGQFTPANDSFSFGTVSFHANVGSATAWNWDFGDGQGYRGWTGPYAVANPTFTYSAAGTYAVKVKVKNCVQTTEVESAPLSVHVTQVQPVVVQTFQAQCNLAPCSFSINQAILFNQVVTGSPTQLQYDWDGNGTFDQTVAVTGGAVASTITHTYTTIGRYAPIIRAIRGTEPPVDFQQSAFTVDDGSGGGGNGGTATIALNGPATGLINTPLTFTATATNCTPAATWSWSPAGGTVSGTGSQVTITWPTVGTKTVTVTNLGCSGATGAKSVSVTDNGNNNGLASSFTFSPAAPATGQAVSFDGSASTGSPTAYSWDFGDGQTASTSTATTSHAYQTAGSYTVTLAVGKPGANCSFGVCSVSSSKPITVTGGPPPLVATFDTGAVCSDDLAGFRCVANTGDAVSFTATTANATSYSWSFGDGATASGLTATHTWNLHGTYSVVLTVSDGRSTASTSRTFIISGTDVGGKKAVILPWVAQTRGALVQTTDLYLLNPTTTPMNVTLAFIRRGNTPETNPPKASRTIQPGTTLYVADVLGTLFNREDVAGFVTVTVDQGSVEPVLTAFNSTVQSGKTFGQTLSGQSWSSTPSATSSTPGSVQVQNLVGLADNTSLLASFGVSNPGSAAATYTMRLFDKLGQQIGTSHDFVVAQFGQRQFLPRDIQSLFGVTNQDDYRVEVRNSGAQIFPFSANLRGGSNDPSFVGAAAGAPEKVYLIGALSSPDALHHQWKSDVVLSNVASEVVLTDVSFIGTGVTARPTAPVHVTLQPGTTERMADVIGSQWSLRNTVGVITLDSNAPGGVFPVVQGESYDSSNPAKRFGQLMPAMTDSQAAGTNASHYLVGLRQDAQNRTVYWVFNPGTVPCVYDLVYLGLDGKELGRIPGVAMNPGIVRQFGPTQHKLPTGGVTGGFTVQVQVKSGKVLAAAQVVNAASNDPAYIVGVTR
ncbi:MAG TPA: PKD domain-containing protein [Thermoanaerobaculia bacterium]|nr:PKD domain-containing protein [Thermoanaerobaculia bacterium]